jgi:hypothetical protein
VRLVYLDESFDAVEYWIAALVIPETQVLPLEAALNVVTTDAAKKYGTDPYAELHGHALMNATEQWTPLAGMLRAKLDVYNAAMRAIGDHDLGIVLRGVNIPRLKRRYVYPKPPRQIVFEHVMERIDDCVKRDGQLALVIADESHDPDGHRDDLQRFRTEGTIGYRHRQLTRILDTMHFAPSHASRMLQAIDLVAYTFRRSQAAGRENHDPRAVKANEALWAHVAGKVKHSRCWVP